MKIYCEGIRVKKKKRHCGKLSHQQTFKNSTNQKTCTITDLIDEILAAIATFSGSQATKSTFFASFVLCEI